MHPGRKALRRCLFPPGNPAALFLKELRPEALRPILSDGLPLSDEMILFYLKTYKQLACR